uniref:SERTA domain-containing protein n=1 Tax=Parascaris univalens TaxID=6257 RepID=A0A914ZKZ0_PARUN
MLETTNDYVESSDVPPSNSKESDLKKERTVARRRIRNPLLTSITVRQLKALLKSHNEATNLIGNEQVPICNQLQMDTSSDEAPSVEPGSTCMTYRESLLQKAEGLIAKNAPLEAPEKDKNVGDVGTFTIAEPCELHKKPYEWLTDCDIESLIGSFAPYST